MKIDVFRPANALDDKGREEVTTFLHEFLDEFGDKKEDIRKAIDYCFRDGTNLKVDQPYGGYVVTGRIDGEMVGAVVVNETGMDGYIPGNILVYIATHRDQRGKGLGKKLMNAAHEAADGDVALHVEPNNPARYLYEKLGYTNKYLEMRFTKG